MVPIMLYRRVNQLCWKCGLSPGLNIASQRFFSKNKTYYQILEVSQEATDEEIKAAYKRLSKKYHPDTSSEINAHEKFIAVNEAFTTLSKPFSRRDYDLKLKYGPDQAGQKKREERRQANETWRDKHYWQRTKEEDQQFRSWYYKEYGMGSPHSPNVPDPFRFFTAKQAIVLAISLGIGLQIARYKWVKARMDLSDAKSNDRLKELEEAKQQRLEWLKKEREKFENVVDSELEKNKETDLHSFLNKNNNVPFPNTKPG
ncbi:dnaJ homolog subfamily C member 10-like [Ostrea edulis]|uniref:dnaJ homolog subfamily C member 10-like n=1 Tax=Ostrea edulis TaxID=37623 RepID=UPI0024AEB135|nr:dnaJ homolog subfamily C member 10-like [Ostrea edulis]